MNRAERRSFRALALETATDTRLRKERTTHRRNIKRKRRKKAKAAKASRKLNR